jgi:hypothetical protein
MTTNNTSAASAANVHHTPGPWTVDGSYIHGPNGKRFLAVAGDGEGQANARLIAAAPELLEALSALYCAGLWTVDTLKSMPSHQVAAINAARSAIINACGGAA